MKIFLVSVRITFVRRALEEEILERRCFTVVLFRDLDDDNARGYRLEYFGESVVQLMNDILALFGRGRRNCRRGRNLGRRRHGWKCARDENDKKN